MRSDTEAVLEEEPGTEQAAPPGKTLLIFTRVFAILCRYYKYSSRRNVKEEQK
jgi:hypothetical protein